MRSDIGRQLGWIHVLAPFVSMLLACSSADTSPAPEGADTGSTTGASRDAGPSDGTGPAEAGAMGEAGTSGGGEGATTGNGATSGGGEGATTGNGATTGGGGGATTGNGATTGTTGNGATGNGSSTGNGRDGGQADGRAVADAGVKSEASANADAAVTGGGIRWIGRVDASNPNAVKFAWSGTGLVATVSGPKISIKLQTEGATSSAFFQPVIDGKPASRFQVMTGGAQTVTLGDGLSARDHKVELYRESEGSYGDSVFLGFADGVVRGAPPASGRLIEIIGDSISAGYGNLGNEVHPPWDNTCGFSLDTESAYQAYGSILGRTLGAEVSIIARSGWGMYRDLNGDTANVLSSIYQNTLGEQAMPRWGFAPKPDAVIVNLGTNDSALGDPGQPFEDAYVAFLQTVRSKYPNASIFLTIGPMTSDPVLSQMRAHLDHVVAAMKDGKISTVDVDPQDGTSTGCDYHPNVAEDQIMAAALSAAIKAKLGW